MPKKTVYLAGPIRALTREQAYNWREIAKQYLEAKGFTVIIPDFRSGETAGEIVGNDLMQIQHCDVVLAYVPEGVPTFGTPMEIFFSSREGKIVILWGGNFEAGQMSPWLEHHCEAYCDMLNEALCYIWKNYSD